MAESQEFANEDVEFSTSASVNELSYDQMTKGVIFRPDLEADFFLTDPLDDVADEDGTIDEADLAWNAEDPNKPGPTLDYLRERPLPIEILTHEMMNLTLDGGVRKRVLEYGSGGTFPPPKSKFYYHYSAWVDDNPETFDTSIGRNAESLIVGDEGDVLPGLRLAVESMKLHEVAQFIISPEYAYGKMGCPPRIGKEAVVVFTIKTVHFRSEERSKTVQLMTHWERNQLSFEAILAGSTSVRSLGNGYYQGGNYQKAIREYRLAADILEEYWGVHTKEDEDKRFDFLCGVYCNLAQCYVKLERGPQACNACKNALRYSVDRYVARIYILSGKAEAVLGNFDRAIRLMEKSLQHGGHKAECTKLQAEYLEEKRLGNARHAAMCKSMFNMKALDTKEKARQQTATEKPRTYGQEDLCTGSGSSDKITSKTMGLVEEDSD